MSFIYCLCSSLLTGGFFLVSQVPLFGDLFFPVRCLSYFVHAILNNRKCLTDLVVLHIFFIIKLISKL